MARDGGRAPPGSPSRVSPEQLLRWARLLARPGDSPEMALRRALAPVWRTALRRAAALAGSAAAERPERGGTHGAGADDEGAG